MEKKKKKGKVAEPVEELDNLDDVEIVDDDESVVSLDTIKKDFLKKGKQQGDHGDRHHWQYHGAGIYGPSSCTDSNVQLLSGQGIIH